MTERKSQQGFPWPPWWGWVAICIALFAWAWPTIEFWLMIVWYLMFGKGPIQ